MNVQLALPERRLPARITWRSENRLSQKEFYELCLANADLRLELTAKGEVIVVPPAGLISDSRNLDVASQLAVWAKRNRRGRAFGPTSAFILPSGATYSPDAAWVSKERLASLTSDQLRRFALVTPEFVIEVMSPSDRLKSAMRKMTEWMADGAALGWLIDGDARTVYIYRAGSPEPEKRTGIKRLAGEGPVVGFRLDLTEVWEWL